MAASLTEDDTTVVRNRNVRPSSSPAPRADADAIDTPPLTTTSPPEPPPRRPPGVGQGRVGVEPGADDQDRMPGCGVPGAGVAVDAQGRPGRTWGGVALGGQLEQGCDLGPQGRVGQAGILQAGQGLAVGQLARWDRDRVVTEPRE